MLRNQQTSTRLRQWSLHSLVGQLLDRFGFLSLLFCSTVPYYWLLHDNDTRGIQSIILGVFGLFSFLVFGHWHFHRKCTITTIIMNTDQFTALGWRLAIFEF